MTRAQAFAKVNLALVVGPLRRDGRHEVATVLQRIDLHDVIELERARVPGTAVEGFEEDTLVRRALDAFAAATGSIASWRVRIEKHIPVAAGLGGGSSDAAAALLLLNTLSSEPLSHMELQALARELGADVPFFLSPGAKLAVGDGTELSPLDLPQDYLVVLALPHGVQKESTAAVYRDFDGRRGAKGFERRRATLSEALDRLESSSDLTALPRNDLASSPLVDELERRGAFRADVTGAGPTVYGLFEREDAAVSAAEGLREGAVTWLARPVEGL
jgi:4-diphosphocytidyl-2-C-methyl-D-erythritol kinase